MTGKNKTMTPVSLEESLEIIETMTERILPKSFSHKEEDSR